MTTHATWLRAAVSAIVGLVGVAATAAGRLFGSAVHYAAGWYPTSVAIGDLNGDQALDLAVANSDDDNVSVLINQKPWVGDLNCDGKVDFDDINPFVIALRDPAAYRSGSPNCNILNGDINGDGKVNFDDINPFVGLLKR